MDKRRVMSEAGDIYIYYLGDCIIKSSQNSSACLRIFMYLYIWRAFSFHRSIIKTDSETGSEVCFGDSNSSVGSVSGGSNNNTNCNNADGLWAGGGVRGDVDGCEGGPIGGCVGKSGGGGSSSSELPSIVERNARIIKWLWNCRKANLQQTVLPPTPSST